MRLKTLKDFVGKKIVKANIRGIPNCDDKPYLDLEFSDGSKCTIVADYGGYTGNSYDEYSRFIKIKWKKKKI